MPGFTHGSWLLDRSSGTVLAVTMFDLRERVAELGATIEDLEEFEVIGGQ
jgi:hypothetical protein